MSSAQSWYDTETSGSPSGIKPGHWLDVYSIISIDEAVLIEYYLE